MPTQMSFVFQIFAAIILLITCLVSLDAVEQTNPALARIIRHCRIQDAPSVDEIVVDTAEDAR